MTDPKEIDAYARGVEGAAHLLLREGHIQAAFAIAAAWPVAEVEQWKDAHADQLCGAGGCRALKGHEGGHVTTNSAAAKFMAELRAGLA